MEFRDLKKQYEVLKPEMDAAIRQVLMDANYISGRQVAELEAALARCTDFSIDGLRDWRK